MKQIITLLLLGIIMLSADERVFTLQTGEVITGEVLSIDDSTQVMHVRTAYGTIEIKSDDLLVEIVEIVLKSGDILKGQLMTESDQSVIVKTSFGIMEIVKADVESMNYLLKNKKSNRIRQASRFSVGNERQIDVFYDPTGYTLDAGTLYFSGLSWGFGITDRIQITSRWADYVFGNFNFRPKFQLFKAGNIEREHAFAVGFHYNTRKNPLRYEWTEKEFVTDIGHYMRDDNGNRGDWVTENIGVSYYGNYNRIGTTVQLEKDYYSGTGLDTARYDTEYNNFQNSWVQTELERPAPVYEVFGAYTISSAKKDGAGRNSMTLGALYGYMTSTQSSYYRIYFAGAVDVRRNIIFNYEVFFDPTYVEWWQMLDYDDNSLSLSPIDEPVVDPIHFDIGFIYAYSDWLRFGIHFQPYLGAVYFKF